MSAGNPTDPEAMSSDTTGDLTVENDRHGVERGSADRGTRGIAPRRASRRVTRRCARPPKPKMCAGGRSATSKTRTNSRWNALRASLLPVVDSLERAVEAARAVAADGPAAAIADGVELSLKLFLDTLREQASCSWIRSVSRLTRSCTRPSTMIESASARTRIDPAGAAEGLYVEWPVGAAGDGDRREGPPPRHARLEVSRRAPI